MCLLYSIINNHLGKIDVVAEFQVSNITESQTVDISFGALEEYWKYDFANPNSYVDNVQAWLVVSLI